MKCKIHIYLLNNLYSQEVADFKYQGKESADNKKYSWEDELDITTNVLEIVETKNSVYKLKGVLSDNPFSEEVLGMRILQLIGDDSTQTEIAVSESILERLRVENNFDNTTISIFIKDDEPLANPIPGIYIASKEFPKRLIYA